MASGTCLQSTLSGPTGFNQSCYHVKECKGKVLFNVGMFMAFNDFYLAMITFYKSNANCFVKPLKQEYFYVKLNMIIISK